MTTEMRFLGAPEIEERGLWIGDDHRVYQITNGLIKAFLPAGTPGEPFAQFMGIDEDKLLEPQRVRHLFDMVMSKYQRETWLWWFAHRQHPKTFKVMIPRQRGTSASVNIEDADTALEQIGPDYRFVGTIHTHPGAWCDPSGTDLETWAKPEFSGLHMILGRNGHFTLNVALLGRHWKYPEGELPLESWDTPWETQDNKPLDETLLEPKVEPKVFSSYGHNWDSAESRYLKWSKENTSKPFRGGAPFGASPFHQISFWEKRVNPLLAAEKDRESLAQLMTAQLVTAAVALPSSDVKIIEDSWNGGDLPTEDRLFPRLVDYTAEGLKEANRGMDEEFASIRQQAKMELSMELSRANQLRQSLKSQELTLEELMENEDLETLSDLVVDDADGGWWDADNRGEMRLVVFVKAGRVFVVSEEMAAELPVQWADIEFSAEVLVDTKGGGVNVLRDDPTRHDRTAR